MLPRTTLSRSVAISSLTLALAATMAQAGPTMATPDKPQAPEQTGDSATAPAVKQAAEEQLTPAMRAEIDRVVREGQQAPATTGRITARSAAASQVRCAAFEGQRYCLHMGWTEDSQKDVQHRAARAVTEIMARRASKKVDQTGGDALGANLTTAARMDPRARAKTERKELTAAAKSVAKVWVLRHEIQGRKLPDGFFTRHPQARALTGSKRVTTVNPTTSKAPEDLQKATHVEKATSYPEMAKIIKPDRIVREQVRSYWCGPASMQMIGGAWERTVRSQDLWAKRLGTTTSGSAITELVRVTNDYTGWDNADRAGKYITLDIGKWTFGEWWMLQMRHIARYRAPVILHPILLKKYYPYLDDDASGHFQVGRGYNKDGAKPNLISYFEPWNQKRFDPTERYISRVQWRRAYNSYRANKEHFQHNIGV